jgi:sortase A
LALCLTLLAFQQGLAAVIIEVKARLAPLLIERAWERAVAAGGRAVKPWPWADTWPVARLSAPKTGVDLLVLAGDSGHALAFGPGLAPYSSPPGQSGIAVIAGHRDTHFAFLQRVRSGDVLLLQTADSVVHRYEVQTTGIVDSAQQGIVGGGESSSLLLVTCYPFGTIRVGGPLRYAVRAVPRSL